METTARRSESDVEKIIVLRGNKAQVIYANPACRTQSVTSINRTGVRGTPIQRRQVSVPGSRNGEDDCSKPTKSTEKVAQASPKTETRETGYNTDLKQLDNRSALDRLSEQAQQEQANPRPEPGGVANK